MKRESLVSRVLFLVLFLPSTSWAQINHCTDPVARAPRLELGSIDPPAAQFAESFGGGGDINASCTANCGSSPSVSCSGSGSCSAVDQNCSSGQQGYVQCGSIRTYCPACDPCSQYNSGYCVYSWNPSTECCEAPPVGHHTCMPICW